MMRVHSSIPSPHLAGSKLHISMRACSACAGDYEDPDRTAGEEFGDLLAGADEYEWQGDEEECDDLDGFDVEFDE
jgi:hypothetical protein